MTDVGMPKPIQSRADLVSRLREGTGQEVTSEQLDEQKVSFIYGNLPASSSITRDQVAARIVRARLVA
jgi:hypothetical protein